ncbi:MAG: helix-turn-helix transcriptional regulator [Anaerolineaceae bacterium]|nr:helix-turn-helix transcriptional regulator [Anaerolineaceae bacterium]
MKLKLKEIREKKNMTQTELAEKLGVTQGTISMWEIGLCNPTFGNLNKLAFELNVKVDELIGEEYEQEPEAAA